LDKTILSVSRVTKRFGGLAAIRNLSFSIKEGEAVGLMGPNGAGKTTLLNLVTGEFKPDSGRIIFKDNDITGLSCHKIFQRGLARTYQIPQPFTNLTVKQNVVVAARFGRGMNLVTAQKKADEILEFIGLADRKEVKAGELVTANLKLLELARVLATEPSLVLLDEVAGGLTEAEIPSLLDILKKIRNSGIAYLLIEHVISVMTAVVDRIVVVNEGEKIAEGTPEEIINNDKVIEVYLG